MRIRSLFFEVVHLSQPFQKNRFYAQHVFERDILTLTLKLQKQNIM